MTVKIDENGLRDLYQAGVACKERISRSGCPSPKTLMRLLRSGLSSRKATRAIDHISSCRECAREFQFLLQVLRQEKTLIQEIGEVMNRGKEVTGLSKDPDARLDSRRAGRPFFPRLSRSGALALAGSVILIIVISVFVISRTPERYRAASSTQIELRRPADEKVSVSSPIFEWRAVANVDYYRLELLDETLLPIWESEQIPQTQFVLPTEAGQKLAAGQVYFWMVTAHLKNGENTRSSPGRFTLKN